MEELEKTAPAETPSAESGKTPFAENGKTSSEAPRRRRTARRSLEELHAFEEKKLIEKIKTAEIELAPPTDWNLPDAPEKAAEAEEKLPRAVDAFDWIKTLLFSMILIIFIFTLIFRGVSVDGESMENTLYNGEYLFISDLFYTPKTGDIVVVESPRYNNGTTPLIKRIIATGGQTVRINFNTWEVWVDGELLSEPYIKSAEGVPMISESLVPDSDGIVEIEVEKGFVFVMGDNRNNSLDSRSSAIGQIDSHYVMGRVIFRLTPFNRIGTVS